MVARVVWDHQVGGSSPSTRTTPEFTPHGMKTAIVKTTAVFFFSAPWPFLAKPGRRGLAWPGAVWYKRIRRRREIVFSVETRPHDTKESSGTVISVKRQRRLKSSTEPVRTTLPDGAGSPQVIRIGYPAAGKEYVKKSDRGGKSRAGRGRCRPACMRRGADRKDADRADRVWNIFRFAA